MVVKMYSNCGVLAHDQGVSDDSMLSTLASLCANYCIVYNFYPYIRTQSSSRRACIVVFAYVTHIMKYQFIPLRIFDWVTGASHVWSLGSLFLTYDSNRFRRNFHPVVC